MSVIFLLIFFSAVQAQVPFLGLCPNVTSMEGFRVDRYLGKWYEAERYFAVFEFAGKCVTAEYSQNSDGSVAVYNKQSSSITGTRSAIMGMANVVGRPDEGKLSVRFPSLPVQFDAPYWILDTDYDNYAVIWSCVNFGILNTRNAWILTRARTPNPEVMNKAYSILDKMRIDRSVSHTLTTQEVVDMALQVIHGLSYLHKKHLLHKDLAARNSVVDDKLKVQIADNALSRDLFPSDYHCLGDNENRPVKWLAIESLLHKTFSTSSDIWSFGVLLWELTTLAQQPYIEIDPFEMSAYLKDGYRLAQPINCPDELFAVMAYCWAMSADERPTLNQLQVCLEEFYTQLTRYV